jgi:predicted nucleic acid-binding protein
MILADTSIWIDYLRGQNDRFARYIQEDRIAMHSMILGELALGSFKDRQKLLRGCASLPLISTVSHEAVMEFIDEFSLMGKGIGWVDANLLASVSQDSVKLWTRDKRLNVIAQDLNLAHVSE